MTQLKELEALNSHKGCAWNVAWHPSGKTLASCGDDKNVCIWTCKNGKWTKTLLTEGHTRAVRQIAWSPCGNLLASASFDATIAIWDKKSGEFQCNLTLEGHENEVKSVAWNRAGNMLATCSRDKSVWVWEITDSTDYEVECAAVLNAHTQDVKKVTWHPEKDILASASYDDTIRMYLEDKTENDWICIATLKSHESTVWSIAFDKTGTRLVSCSDDKTLKIWQQYPPNSEINNSDEETWKCVCTLSGFHERPIYDVDWCHVTGLIATASGDNKIHVFAEKLESNRDEPVFELVTVMHNAHDEDVNSVNWNPVDGTLASCSDDGLVKIWQLT